MFLIRRKLTWSRFNKKHCKLGLLIVMISFSRWFKHRINVYRKSEQRTLSTELFETLSHLNHCVVKWFTVSKRTNRIANHLIQNGTPKRILRIIWLRTRLQSEFHESFYHSAEAGMHRPEGGGGGGYPPPPYKSHPVCVCVYIYIYISIYTKHKTH